MDASNESVGLIVPAAPYGPASYYNYDRVINNAFTGEQASRTQLYSLTPWLDYQSVLDTTGLPIEIWRMFSALIVTFFVIKALDIFEAIRKRQILALKDERDHAQQAMIESKVSALRAAEGWTNALVSISRRIAELDHVDDILIQIEQTVRQMLRVDFVGLAILSQDSTALELKCYSIAQKTELVTGSTLYVTNGQIQNVLRTSRPYRSQDGEASEVFEGICFFTDQHPKALAIVPLKLENTTIGSLWIARWDPDLFSETDLIWLESMADQVAIAIQHGLMTSQLQSLSIIEERGRIAREMHDGLAQVLGYLNLQVQTLGSLLKQGKSEKLQDELTQMRQAIQLANADVRENILSLRTTLADEKGLIQAVEEYLAEFGIQTNIKTRFHYEVEGDLHLSSVAEVQLVCILQEALTNVRKHALASQVEVNFKKIFINDNYHVHMHIVDDGVGISRGTSKRNFGLQTMQERAEGVGGTLAITSERGNGTGTCIDTILPCLPQERFPKHSVVISK